MADRLKDKEDRALEAMFGSEPVRDDGFSVKVVSRVRRRIWVQRLSLPTAFVIGAAIAAKPIVQFASFMPKIFSIIPQGLANIIDVPLVGMPQVSTIILGIMLLAAMLMLGRMLEE